MSDFISIRKGFEKRMEDLLIDMSNVTQPDGILVGGAGGIRLLASDFRLYMNEMERGYNSTGIVMIPAAGGSENND